VTSIELAIRQTGDREKHKPTIRVKDGEYYIDLPIDEIDYIESDGNYLLYHAGVKVYKARAIIRQMLEYLPTDTFIQTHRAYIVNKRKIEKSNSKNVVVNSKEIPVSKTYLNAIMT
jgi:DNA-binding LytR/AlgR family response regulator